MNTESKQINVNILRPTEGYYLTQKDLKENEERIFSEQVWLGPYDLAENYIEVNEVVRRDMEAKQQRDYEDSLQQSRSV